MERSQFELFSSPESLSSEKIKRMDELFASIVPPHKLVTRSQDLEMYKIGSAAGYTDAEIKEYKTIRNILVDHPIDEDIASVRVIRSSNDEEY